MTILFPVSLSSIFVSSAKIFLSSSYICTIVRRVRIECGTWAESRYSAGTLASTLQAEISTYSAAGVSGWLIKTRENFAAHATARRGNEFKSVSERLPTRAGALVTPSCTVSVVTTPPALYYESNLSQREAVSRAGAGI